ncbi:MAG: aminomethyltransferase family protein [Phycisphaerales bacterium]|nr:aminomethyltransferase family protein [Phycisphaerales bacterium]
MPIPSPFHPRTAALCTSYRWKDWAGYYAVCSYDVCHDREYYAMRHSAGLMDVTPLFKYDITGPDAAAFIAWLTVRDATRLKVNQITYGCWCDAAGKLIDDGTIWRLDDAHYRITAADPSLSWFRRHADAFDVTITDTTDVIASASLQGPTSRAILRDIGIAGIDELRFFRMLRTTINGAPVIVSRTGYSGDLGYELWTDAEHACAVWDAVMEAGAPHSILPVGLDALDNCRVEAGFIMNGVDYYAAHHCLIESRKTSPDEAGLGWTVQLDRDAFIGQDAIRAERARGSARAFIGLVLGWEEYEMMFAEHGLPPEVCSSAWRETRPIYATGGRQIGYASSGSWSPTLKKNLVLATVDAKYAEPGTELRCEVTVEYERRTVRATVTERPFFDPPRKRS